MIMKEDGNKKEPNMSQNSLTSKTLTWIFFVVGAGSLIAAGIYLEKVMLLGPSLWDALRAVAFGLMGIVVLWISIFSQKQ